MRPLLILLILIQLSIQQADVVPACQPWGVRTFFGEFYTNTSEINQLYIVFNADKQCPNMTVAINNHIYNCTEKVLHVLETQPVLDFTAYIYRCAIYGIEFNDSEVLILPYSFRSSQKPLAQPEKSYSLRVLSKFARGKFRALVMGDWGLLDNRTRQIYYDIFPCMLKTIEDSQIVMTLFMGDLGYELTDENGVRYKQSLQALEPVTSIMPFMLSPGNHDTQNSTYHLFAESFFSPYWETNYNYFYAMYFGGIEIVSYNPEKYVYEAFTDKYPNGYPLNNNVDVKQLVKEHYRKEYSKDGSIKTRLVMSHYSMYCSNPFDLQCAANGDAEHLRYFHKTFERHNVTFSLGAHIHLYERSYPIGLEGSLSSFTNLSTSIEKSIYKNPSGITFISEGAAGNSYFVNRVPYPLKEFTATTVQNTGYGVLQLQSGLNITYTHYTAKDCSVVDTVRIYRTTGVFGTNLPWTYLVAIVGGALFLVFVTLLVIFLIRRRHLLKRMQMPKQNEMELQEEKYEEQI